jgi:hypothetical protein
MPSQLPLNSDGFEDPDEFFRSPNTVNGSQRDEALESIVNALRRTPGGAAVESIDGGSGSKKKGRKGRMSQLGAGEESDQERGEDGLLDDGDDVFEDCTFNVALSLPHIYSLNEPCHFTRTTPHRIFCMIFTLYSSENCLQKAWRTSD